MSSLLGGGHQPHPRTAGNRVPETPLAQPPSHTNGRGDREGVGETHPLGRHCCSSSTNGASPHRSGHSATSTGWHGVTACQFQDGVFDSNVGTEVYLLILDLGEYAREYAAVGTGLIRPLTSETRPLRRQLP